MKNLQNAVNAWNLKVRHNYDMGTWTRPAQLTAAECIRLRDLGYTPGQTVRFGGFTGEFISYPFPSEIYGATIMVREPGDPTTMIESAMNPIAIAEVQGKS